MTVEEFQKLKESIARLRQQGASLEGQYKSLTEERQAQEQLCKQQLGVDFNGLANLRTSILNEISVQETQLARAVAAMKEVMG